MIDCVWSLGRMCDFGPNICIIVPTYAVWCVGNI
jgi:hypothetical protein